MYSATTRDLWSDTDEKAAMCGFFCVQRKEVPMTNPIIWLRERLFRPNLEPEYEEPVDHDIVIINGKEVTADDPEERQ